MNNFRDGGSRGFDGGGVSLVGGRLEELRRLRGARLGYSADDDWAVLRRRQVDCLIFNGDDPDDWVFRMEQFFSIHRCSEREKIVTMGIDLEGEALSWFQWHNG